VGLKLYVAVTMVICCSDDGLCSSDDGYTLQTGCSDDFLKSNVEFIIVGSYAI